MKKILLIVVLLATLVILAEEVAQPQMLIVVEGIDKQRKIYPEDAQKRISQQAIIDGFKFLSKGNKLDKAMYEFNRAWRFAPKRYEAWEGAAQVQTILAFDTPMLSQEKTIKYLQNSVELREKAVPLATASKKIMAQTQLAMSYNQLALQYLKNEKPELAKEPLGKAEKIIIPITVKYPNDGFAHFVYATNAYCRKDFETYKKEIKEAQRCNFKVPVTMLEKLK